MSKNKRRWIAPGAMAVALLPALPVVPAHAFAAPGAGEEAPNARPAAKTRPAARNGQTAVPAKGAAPTPTTTAGVAPKDLPKARQAQLTYGTTGGPRNSSRRAVPPGQPFTYTLSAKNNGPSTARNVTSTDTLPANIEFVSSADGCTAAGQVVTCGPEPTLAVGATKTWAFTARIKPSYKGDGSDLGNVTTGKSDADDPDPGNDGTDPVLPPGPYTPQADLATTKTAVGTTPKRPGESFDYLVSVKNNGPSDADNVKVSDTLPTGLTFVSSPDGCSAAGQVVTCGPEASLAAGATKNWTIRVRIDPSYEGDGSDLGNVASASSDTSDSDPGNNDSPPARPPGDTVAKPNADLATTKVTTTDTPVSPGETFDYRVTVTNNGPSTAVNVTTSDPLPAALSFVSSPDGCTAAGQTVTCGPEATLAPGASKTWTFTVRLDPDYTGDGSDALNLVTATSDTDDDNPDDNTNPRPGTPLPGGRPALPKADIGVTKTPVGNTRPTPGTTFDYRIVVTNDGPSADAYNVKVGDSLPAQLTFVSSSPEGCTATGQQVSCKRPTPLPVGGSQEYLLTVRLAADYTGDGKDILNTTKVTADNADPNPDNDVAVAGLPGGGAGDPSADLTTKKETVTNEPVKPGETFDYRVTATNNGPSTAKGAKAADELPEGLSFVSSPDGCTAVGQTVTCGPDDIATGASKAWVFKVRLDPSYLGRGDDLANTASVEAVTGDPDPGNNPSDPTPPPGGQTSEADADLVLKKSARMPAGGAVKPGGTFDYVLTVTNNGPSTAVNVKASDPLPSQVGFVSSPDGCTASGRTVNCGPVAALLPGQSKSWRFTVRLAPSYKGNGTDIRNEAKVTGDTKDRDPGNNTNDPKGSLPKVKPEPPKQPPGKPTGHKPTGHKPTGNPGPSLPETGSDGQLIAVAAGTSLLGGALMFLTRRRRDRSGT
ncbi:LPXTG cell wall anchor domain-containing protein [Streptomyces sp. NPDC051561]|uniref:LPXTG cell wall anchor domain-containing protein n=1 Tax=Streptomyces sp. NPDC051561 TaxID=3365658 RepID=UPI00379B558B